MLLRQLYITRRHILAVHRKELMAGTQEQTPHPIESVTRMSDLANQLKENAWEDHHLLYNMSRAFFCGVGWTPTTMHARGCLAAYTILC